MPCLNFVENYTLWEFNVSLYVGSSLVCINETLFSKESWDSIPQNSKEWAECSSCLLIIFSSWSHPVLAPVEAAVDQRECMIWITEEEMIVFQGENLSVKKKGVFSLQLQHPALEPTQILEPSQVQHRVTDPEEIVLGRSSTPPSQKYPVSAWRNQLSLVKYITCGGSVSHMAFLCLCYIKKRWGLYIKAGQIINV